MNKKLLLSALLLLAVTFAFSQTKEELEAQKAEKQATRNTKCFFWKYWYNC